MKKKTGIELIAAERQRQIAKEGWTSGHDDKHKDEELSKAAAAYAFVPFMKDEIRYGYKAPDAMWPFKVQYWKPVPEDRIKELVKAGALIAAEIDRLQRKQEN